MISFIVDFLGGILGWLGGVLPGSPFQALIQNFTAFGKAFHWLNWFVPIGDFLTVFLLFLGALIAWYVIHIILTEGVVTTKSLVKG